ncbi:hypothetical protein, partial [Escherichia coli]|uniref:hypothetical protein n=1 Tax=Escherichia coli TaxID=562 RepID=UPI0013C2C999
IGIYSPGIWRIPHLEKFLAQPCQKLSLLRPVPQEVDAIAVWGLFVQQNGACTSISPNAG